MTIFKVDYIYKDTKGEEHLSSHRVTGPNGSQGFDCERVMNMVASCYHIVPDYFDIEIVPERTSHGFLHPLFALLPAGGRARMDGWYI